MAELTDLMASTDLGKLFGLTDCMLDTKIDIKDIRVNGSDVHIDFESVGGGDITFRYGGTEYTLDCTTGSGPGGIATVILDQGTDEEPMFQFIHMFYSENSDSVEVATSAVIPADGQFGPVCYCLCPTAAKVTADNSTIYIHRLSDVTTDGTRGGLSYEREKLRLGTGGNNRIVGCDVELEITTNASVRDNINVISIPGTFYQLHRHDWAGYESDTYGIRAIGQKISECAIANYDMITDLGTIAETAEGVALVDGDSIFIDIVGIGTSCACKRLAFMVSKDKWAAADDAIMWANGLPNLKYPREVSHLCFTLARIVLTYNTANGGTWSNALSDTTDVWRSETISTTTPNYPSNYPNSSAGYIGPTLTEVGAKAVRVHFRDFDTERNYDYLGLRNAGGSLIHKYHGSLGAFTSATITGETIRPYFQSDGSVTRKGAYIDRFEYLVTVSTGGGEIIDMR